MNDIPGILQRGPFRSKKILIPAIILFSGICWYLAFDLSGHFGWLIWIAPAPVLYICSRVSGGQAFVIAFLAFLIGRCSWLSYLLSVLPMAAVIILTLSLPLIFAGIVLLVRMIVRRSSSPLIASLAFPVLWSAFEFLSILTSRDGTFGSLAYTQCNFLPVIQLASLTGILGISFLLCFIPSAIAVSGHYYDRAATTGYLLPVTALSLLLVIGYGSIRIRNHNNRNEISVGMVALDEHAYRSFLLHNNVYTPTPEAVAHITDLYIQQIDSLAGQGARVILLPEKVIPVNDFTDSTITGLFSNAAHRLRVTIIAGYTHAYKDHLENQSLVISPEGTLITNYAKVNLFEGEALEGFSPGKEPALFDLDGVRSGTAICKDLDFQQYMRRYGREHASILYVPAWDFVADGWLHDRMAILRGVENGYSIVRNARQGRLTISDPYGRVLKEASSEDRKTTDLIGTIQPRDGNTLYSRWGDWFGWIDLVAAAVLLFFLITGRKKDQFPSKPSTIA